MEKELPKLLLSTNELNTILVWYETLKDEGGNEEVDDALYAKLDKHFDEAVGVG